VSARERPPAGRLFERRLGHLLIAVTYAAVVLLTAGVALLLLNGISPLAGGPPLDPGLLVGDIRRLAPSGFLWLGLIAVIATPVSRVVAAAIGVVRAGEWLMALVAAAILVIIGLGIGSALLTR
jgi:uncharacterized membrane protein